MAAGVCQTALVPSIREPLNASAKNRKVTVKHTVGRDRTSIQEKAMEHESVQTWHCAMQPWHGTVPCNFGKAIPPSRTAFASVAAPQTGADARRLILFTENALNPQIPSKVGDCGHLDYCLPSCFDQRLIHSPAIRGLRTGRT